jgi:hypothetical protein
MTTMPHFKELYLRYQNSGLSLTVRDFCRNEGLSESRFYYWQKKLKQITPWVTEEQPGFIPLLLKESAGTPSSFVPGSPKPIPSTLENQSVTCEISYSNGITVKLQGTIHPDQIRSLIT